MGVKIPPILPTNVCPDCCLYMSSIGMTVDVLGVGLFTFTLLNSGVTPCMFSAFTYDPYTAWGALWFCTESGSSDVYIYVPELGFTDYCGIVSDDCSGFGCTGIYGSTFTVG